MLTPALHGTPRVFLVDDHPLFRLGLASLLRSEAQCVICGEADDAQSALSMLRTTPADLVIIDIELGGTNGIELLKQLKAELPELRTLLMSMHDEEFYIERALRAGASGYLRKDSPPDQVVDAIRRVLHGGLVLSAQSTETILRRMTMGGGSTAAPELHQLSDRELEIFQMMGQGVGTRECADRLHISIKTVEAHQASIKSKLGLKGVNQLRRNAVLWVNQLRTDTSATSPLDSQSSPSPAPAPRSHERKPPRDHQ